MTAGRLRHRHDRLIAVMALSWNANVNSMVSQKAQPCHASDPASSLATLFNAASRSLLFHFIRPSRVPP
jgi:hypothetical protein